MARVIVNDASCLIDLRKGRLLHVLCTLPYEFIVPLPVRASEILDFTPQEWALLDGSGMATYDLPPSQVGQAFEFKKRHGRLSANDCFCLVTAQVHAEAICSPETVCCGASPRTTGSPRMAFYGWSTNY